VCCGGDLEQGGEPVGDVHEALLHPGLQHARQVQEGRGPGPSLPQGPLAHCMEYMDNQHLGAAQGPVVGGVGHGAAVVRKEENYGVLIPCAGQNVKSGRERKGEQRRGLTCRRTAGSSQGDRVTACA
jgi:hypothetical protein